MFCCLSPKYILPCEWLCLIFKDFLFLTRSRQIFHFFSVVTVCKTQHSLSLYIGNVSSIDIVQNHLVSIIAQWLSCDLEVCIQIQTLDDPLQFS